MISTGADRKPLVGGGSGAAMPELGIERGDGHGTKEE